MPQSNTARLLEELRYARVAFDALANHLERTPGGTYPDDAHGAYAARARIAHLDATIASVGASDKQTVVVYVAGGVVTGVIGSDPDIGVIVVDQNDIEAGDTAPVVPEHAHHVLR